MKRFILVLGLVILGTGLFAGVTEAKLAYIEEIRIEAGMAIVSLKDERLVDNENGGKTHQRLWIDLNNPIGRAEYATVMMAFSMDKKVIIRGYTGNGYIWDMLKLYDICVKK